MKIIVVSGEKSGVGKTYIVQQLLKCLKDWSALKVTVSKEGGCPRGINCGVCAQVKKPFYIIKDRKIIQQAGTDTARMKEAGAKQVIWLKAKPLGLKKGLAMALAEFSACRGIIIEGTSVLKYVKPDINIHVFKKGVFKLC